MTVEINYACRGCHKRYDVVYRRPFVKDLYCHRCGSKLEILKELALIDEDRRPDEDRET